MQGAGNFRSFWAEAPPAAGGQGLGGGYFFMVV